MTWTLSNWQRSDKSIRVSGPVDFEVDYDDVDTDAVDLLIPHLIKVLNEGWAPLHAYHCEDDDCDRAWEGYVLHPGRCVGCGKPMTLRELTSS